MVEILLHGKPAPDEYQERVNDWLDYVQDVTDWEIDLNAVKFGDNRYFKGRYISARRNILLSVNKLDSWDERRRVFFHELTHHVHYMNELLDARDYGGEEEYYAAFMLTADSEIRSWYGIPFPNCVYTNKLDKYAAKNPVEFVAVAGETRLEHGNEYTETFMRYYTKMRGPTLPDCAGYSNERVK